MQRKSFADMECPIARGLERVGEWWSILILREAFQGATRFDEFLQGLDIAPNMLSRRLKSLVEAGLLERRRYTESPPRDEYLLTARGRGFQPVLIALFAWGNAHFVTEGCAMVLRDEKTGADADPVLMDRVSGRLMADQELKFVPGPAASEAMKRQLLKTAAPGKSVSTSFRKVISA